MCISKIEIKNFKDGDTVTYGTLLLKGSLLDSVGRRIKSSEVLEVKAPFGNTVWHTRDGFFAAVILLSEGNNVLELRVGSCHLSLTAVLQERTEGLDVLPIYVVWSDDDGRLPWAADGDTSLKSAKKRLDLSSSLIQTLLGEELRARGLGQKSFRLAQGIVMDSSLSVSDAKAMPPAQLWATLAKELASSSLDSPGRRFLVAASFAAPQGAGRLALISASSLGAIPTDLSGLPGALVDQRPPPVSVAPPGWDTPSYAAAMAVALGAAAHELGHAFDLAHASGLMASAFPRFASALLPKPSPPQLSPSCAALLAAHPAFNGPFKPVNPPTFQLTRRVIQSEVGLRIVQLRCEDGLVVRSWELTGSCHMILPLPPPQLAKKTLSLFVMDIYGNISRFPHPGHRDLLLPLKPCAAPAITCNSPAEGGAVPPDQYGFGSAHATV